MKIIRINNLNKPLTPLKRQKENLLLKCDEVRHKKLKDLSSKELPFFGAFVGLFSPLPFGFLIGYGLGKLMELGINFFKKKWWS